MEEVAAEVAMRGCCACTARAGSGCAVEIGAVEEVAVEVAAEVAMRGGCACTARAGSGCANTGVCAITDAGGISVAVVLDSCSVGDVCGCCCVVLGPAEVPGASGGCCSSSVCSVSSSTAPAYLRAFKVSSRKARLRRRANAVGRGQG